MVFHEVCHDLEREGYEVQSFLIPAAGVNAPHQRQRVWFVAYSNDKGRSSKLGEVQKENGEISEWNNNAKPCNTNNGDATNPCSGGLQTNNTLRESTQQEYITRMGSKNFSTNSQDIRSKYALENGELEGGRSWQSYKRNFWDSFPSKSPVCGGDDGLPRELDNITFPKWRNESIKGYGNAIVPQVAYEIFKTIEKFENSL